jgi:hypothetical protein
MYRTVEIAPQQILGVETELLFTIAHKKTEGGGLVCFSFTYEDERSMRAALHLAKRSLKEAKKRGAIGLFVFSDNFGKQSTEMEYLMNVYPSIEKCSELIAPEHPYVLVHVME